MKSFCKLPLSPCAAEMLGRASLSIVFFWFGFLKIIGLSPATQLVQDLLDKTLPFLDPDGFVVFLGVWEAAIGLLFFFPRWTRLAFALLAVQMFTTFGPLVLLPEQTWSTFLLVPTLEGQYILKNFTLIALGYSVLVANSLRTRDNNCPDSAPKK